MNKSLDSVVQELETKVINHMEDSKWYQKRFKELEIIILNLKETIDELKKIGSTL